MWCSPIRSQEQTQSHAHTHFAVKRQEKNEPSVSHQVYTETWISFLLKKTEPVNPSHHSETSAASHEVQSGRSKSVYFLHLNTARVATNFSTQTFCLLKNTPMKVKGEENKPQGWEDKDEDEEGWDFLHWLCTVQLVNNMEDLKEWINAIFHLPAPVNPWEIQDWMESRVTWGI